MSLSEIITVTIDRASTSISRAGFGTPLIAAYIPKPNFPFRTQSYTSLSDMVSAGFLPTDPAYKAASDIFAQNPSPTTVKVGRRDLFPSQVLHVTPEAPVVGTIYTLTISGYKNVAYANRGASGNYITDTWSLSATASHTDAEDVVDAFIAAITETGDYALSKSGTGASAMLVVTANNTTMKGLLFQVTASDTFSVYNNTADPGIQTDLDAINTYDPDWFAFILDSNSENEIVGTTGTGGAADWAESHDKMFCCQTSDPTVANVAAASDTTSVWAQLNAASYDNTIMFWHKDGLDYVCGAMLGIVLPRDPGSVNWAYQQLSSVSAQRLTSTQRSNLTAKNLNFLFERNDVAVTHYGNVISGEWADVVRGTFWLKARLQEDVYAALVSNQKIPYTNQGIQAIRGVILGRLQNGVDVGFLADTPAPTCTVPKAEDVSAQDKQDRWLRNVKFRATLAGAVNHVAIEGELV